MASSLVFSLQPTLGAWQPPRRALPTSILSVTSECFGGVSVDGETTVRYGDLLALLRWAIERDAQHQGVYGSVICNGSQGPMLVRDCKMSVLSLAFAGPASMDIPIVRASFSLIGLRVDDTFATPASVATTSPLKCIGAVLLRKGFAPFDPALHHAVLDYDAGADVSSRLTTGPYQVLNLASPTCRGYIEMEDCPPSDMADEHGCHRLALRFRSRNGICVQMTFPKALFEWTTEHRFVNGSGWRTPSTQSFQAFADDGVLTQIEANVER